MRTGKKLLALGLAASLLMGMGMTAFATDQPADTENQTNTTNNTTNQGTTETKKISTGNTITLYNTLTCADGVVAPEVEYTYTFTLTGKPATVTDAGPAIDPQRITVSNSSKTGSVEVTLPTFPVAGEYTYTITQSTEYDADAVEGESLVDTDATSYTVYVYVKNSGKERVVSAVTATTTKEGSVKKVEKLNFAETFNKKVDLAITKTVTGDYSDKSVAFDFKVNLTFPTTYVASQNEKTEYTISLADGGTYTIENVPAGTTYTVEETQKENYIGSVIVTEGGAAGTEITAEKSKNVKAENKVIKATAGKGKTETENKNSAAFTNELQGIIITGVTTNNLPFVAMIVVALAALAGFAVISKRRVR